MSTTPNGSRRIDPTFRLIGSEKTWDRGAALTSRLQTFETGMLAEEENFGSFAHINCDLIAKVEAIDAQQRIVLDMDSTEIPVYGQQENSAYNGHFESPCFSLPGASWKTARRVVAKVEFHFGGLFPRVGFIVTNLETDSRSVMRF